MLQQPLALYFCIPVATSAYTSESGQGKTPETSLYWTWPCNTREVAQKSLTAFPLPWPLVPITVGSPPRKRPPVAEVEMVLQVYDY